MPNIKRFNRRMLLGAGAAATVLPFVHSNSAAAVTSGASASSAHEHALYQAAKKEGHLTWYVSQQTVQVADQLAHEFGKLYPGVTANVDRMTDQVAFERLSEDIRAGAAECDVLSVTDIGHYIFLANKRLLLKYVPENETKVFDAYKGLDPNGYYFVTSAGLITISYDTRKLKKDQVPQTWTDLLKPEWKNQIALGSPEFSGYVGTWVVEMRKLYGWKFFTQLAKNNPQIGRSINDTVTMLNAGEREVGVSAEAPLLTSAARGNPVAEVYPKDGALLMLAPSAIIRSTKRPNAAKLFMEFLLSPEASKIEVAAFSPSLRPEVAPPKGAMPISQVKTIRPTIPEINKGIPEVIKLWRNTFGV